jgi:hypothetical protein
VYRARAAQRAGLQSQIFARAMKLVKAVPQYYLANRPGLQTFLRAIDDLPQLLGLA